MKGRLGPGQMIACDLVNGGFENNWSIKQKVAAKRPYGDWLRANSKVRFAPLLYSCSPAYLRRSDGRSKASMYDSTLQTKLARNLNRLKGAVVAQFLKDCCWPA